jgi:Carboxypeptidase regulatory-like domain
MCRITAFLFRFTYLSLFSISMATLLTLGGGVSARAQSDSGSLRVEVQDVRGGAVSGAAVTLTRLGTNISLSKSTETDGYATFDPIQRGVYAVETSMSGFQTVRTTDVRLDGDDRMIGIS